jgi:hypothetical protein
MGHLLGHIEKQLAIFLVGFAQQAAKLVEEARILTRSTPGDVIGGPTLG